MGNELETQITFIIGREKIDHVQVPAVGAVRGPTQVGAKGKELVGGVGGIVRDAELNLAAHPAVSSVVAVADHDGLDDGKPVLLMNCVRNENPLRLYVYGL